MEPDLLAGGAQPFVGPVSSGCIALLCALFAVEPVFELVPFNPGFSCDLCDEWGFLMGRAPRLVLQKGLAPFLPRFFGIILLWPRLLVGSIVV